VKNSTYTFALDQEQSVYIDNFRRWAADDVGKLPMRDALLCAGSSTFRMWAGALCAGAGF